MDIDENLEEYKNDKDVHDSDEDEDDGSDENEQSDDDDEYVSVDKQNNPRTFTQLRLNDLIRILGLPKDGTEYLTSELKANGMLSSGTKVAYSY